MAFHISRALSLSWLVSLLVLGRGLCRCGFSDRFISCLYTMLWVGRVTEGGYAS